MTPFDWQRPASRREFFRTMGRRLAITVIGAVGGGMAWRSIRRGCRLGDACGSCSELPGCRREQARRHQEEHPGNG